MEGGRITCIIIIMSVELFWVEVSTTLTTANRTLIRYVMSVIYVIGHAYLQGIAFAALSDQWRSVLQLIFIPTFGKCLHCAQDWTISSAPTHCNDCTPGSHNDIEA